jgi:protein AFG1
MLREDAHQEYIISKIQALHDQLATYVPPPISLAQPSSTGLFGRLFGSSLAEPLAEASPPNGLYLFGDVGTGKSMLMDLFYDTLPPNVTRKRRVHFHAFMIDVHKRIHTLKSTHGHLADPILPVARDLASQASVLCLDEFQVTDIVDAMILRRLFECLIKFGVVAVMTSNRHPDELYKNGIQRASFIPCIDLIKEKFDVTDLDSGTDYRKIPRALSQVYFSPATPENRSELDKIFNALTSSSGLVHNRKLPIWGNRGLTIPASSKHVARFTFEELCGQPLSAADYLEVTKEFGTVFVMDIPKMNLNHKDKARRFITFIDACYESKTKLFVLSEVPVYQIFSDDASSTTGISDHVRGVMDDLGLPDNVIGASSIFSGEEEVFAFARACSRLVQMGTKEWAESARS